MLDLSKPTFFSIGALGWDSGWKVVKQPLTLNINELVRVGDYPPPEFAEHTFKTASIRSDDARSMESGLFWFCLAARKSFMFDESTGLFLIRSALVI